MWRTKPSRSWAVAAIAATLVGCASGGLGEPGGEPIPDMEGFARGLAAATTPAAPHQVNFDWSLDEGGSRVNGRGVVRVVAPERIRVDLFGARGETYLSAALVDDAYRLPPAASGAVTLPSPALFWAALGILAPPQGAELASATRQEQAIELRFATPAGETFAYTFLASGPESAEEYRLERLERAGQQGVIETVTLEWDADRPARTRYRDWSAYRDLSLELEAPRTVSSFPDDIWTP